MSYIPPMRKLVIANRGTRNTGKTSSIKEVYYLLKSKGYRPLLEEWQYEEGRDIKAIFDVNGVKVGIESQGDQGYDMETTMDAFIEAGCEIIVTACWMQGNTYRKVYKNMGEDLDYDIIWYGHFVYQVLGAEEVQKTFNWRYAEQVVRLIEERIEGKF